MSAIAPSRQRTPPTSAGGYFAILASGFVSLVLLLFHGRAGLAGFRQMGKPGLLTAVLGGTAAFVDAEHAHTVTHGGADLADQTRARRLQSRFQRCQ